MPNSSYKSYKLTTKLVMYKKKVRDTQYIYIMLPEGVCEHPGMQHI